ncbi:MAG: HAD family hydrolase [Longimicrobiales bacterium]
MLFLFDIDGTLTRGGPAKDAFQLGLEEAFGTAGPIDDHDFSGKTDPQIVRELMTRAGKTPDEIEEHTETVWEVYLGELELRIADDPVTVLPGVRDLVEALDARSDVYLALVTGNLERGARLKLGSVGLADFFPVGGFGSDHEVRNELPPVALGRASDHWGRSFQGPEAVVIGDTPRDVGCGKAVGAVTVTVATGRFSMDELVRTEPDLALSDFADTDRTIDRVLALFP